MGDETAVVIWEQISQRVPQTAFEKENDLRLVVSETVMD